MNILLLYNGYRSVDYRTRLGLFSKLSNYFDFNIYGPKEHEINPTTAPLKFDEKITLQDLCNHFTPDIIIIPLYAPKPIMCLIPKKISKLSIPVVIIEEDHYTKERDPENILQWYKDIDVNLVIRRHFYTEKYDFKSVWLPFCASDKEFFPDKFIERKNIIGFAGSYENNPDYEIRKLALKTLGNTNLIEKPYGKVMDRYSYYLRQFKSMLTCAGGTIHTPMAKFFEIGLSGTAVLTNSMYEDKLLFGDKQCYFEYKDDCSDLIELAKFILNEDVSEVVNNCTKIIKEKHTDDKRLIELVNILSALHEGKEIPRIWGQ